MPDESAALKRCKSGYSLGPRAETCSGAMAMVLGCLLLPTAVLGQRAESPTEPAEISDASWASLRLAVGKTLGQQAMLRPSSDAGEGQTEQQFGESVAISGDTVLIGAYRDDILANANQGSVYVFTRNADTWSVEAKLTANDGAANDLFGISVALDGDTAVVGASFDDGSLVDQGAAYVFVRSAGIWTQQSKLIASDATVGSNFGRDVAIAGDTVAVGAEFADVAPGEDQGSAYIFTRSSGVWTQQARLFAADGSSNDRFGCAVAVDGDTALVGAHDDGSGSTYVFTREVGAWSQQAKLSASDGETGDRFGFSVALDDDTALIGAYFDDVGANTEQGSAYVFVRNIETWSQQARLTASDGLASARFGRSVAIDVDTAVVGAYLDNAVGASSGSAYVFSRSVGIWSQQTKLSAIDGAPSDLFGRDVDLDGDIALAGVPLDDILTVANQGSAHVFKRSAGNWAAQKKLTASDGTEGDWFGYAVAISSDTAIIGALFDDINGDVDRGAAYVFARVGDSWVFEDKLSALDGAAGDRFGHAVAVSGDTALVGAYLDQIGANASQGSAYVFVRESNAWEQQQKLVSADGAAGDRFGIAVAMDGDTALVGANRDDVVGVDQGSAYVFTRSGSAWTQQAKLTAPDGATDDRFGISVALNGDTALAGAYAHDVGATSNQGSAYVFTGAGSSWSAPIKLTSDDGATDDFFGVSVALSGDDAVIGALGTAQGAAYVFTRDAGVWTQQAKLVASDGTSSDAFGIAVAIHSNRAVVGAYLDDAPALDQGSAYLFVRNDGIWSQQSRLTAANSKANDQFGYSVAMEANTTLIGALLVDQFAPDGIDQGAAYVFASLLGDSIFSDGFEQP
ncbi:FG-GAP repeat protein [Pseudomarimonas arenosa]|uniref:FG-GAP repeat protein n=1 Tax=Pseudomarimonas arenosa TaxID=2774145 RepID=A0AAW3ZLF2_9GAMM|nr:FG-GAP repeat protein [Pseudomarimonas arenosa]MBD8526798.1 FG-GAP repeat protein [Pseudomarimonas arenosa]